MFDIGWQELFIVAILAIVVVGPKDLPRAVRTVMAAIRKLRGMASEFQSGLDEVAREAELDDIRREANKIAHYDVTEEIKSQLDPDGEIEAAADIDKTVRDTMTDVDSKSDENAAAGSVAEVTEAAVESAPPMSTPPIDAPETTASSAVGADDVPADGNKV